MNRRLASGCAVLAALGVSLLSWQSPAPACATAPPRNQPVEIADESAIILWDAESKTQHFIRKASFQTRARDFGFLVPTPTKPTLEEADDEAFSRLAKLTAPRVETRSAPDSPPGCGFGCGAAGKKTAAPAGEAAPPVRVLDEKRVSGYDAVVLEADDPKELSRWLKEHGYDFSPALSDWAAHYIQAKWKITAFKIATDSPGAGVSTSAVRMTFRTERPFFPYREPAAPEVAGPHPRRMLRVFFLSERKVEGTLGEGGKPWPGTVAWANEVPAADRDELLRLVKLPADAPPAKWWLTEFEDRSSPRPGTADVYFFPAKDQTPVARPPHIRYVSADLPNAVLCYGLLVCLLMPSFVRCWRRRRTVCASFVSRGKG